jgi:hypothetical protein
LVYQEFLVYPNGNKAILNLKENAIRFPKEGIVVAIDHFFAGEEYVYYTRTNMHYPNGNIQDTIVGHYGGSIRATYGANLYGKGFRYNYIKKMWAEIGTPVRTKTSPAPMIKLELIECD